MHYSIHRSRRSCAQARAFTLLELLIVIGIISLLIVLGLSVAGKVTGGGKVKATEGTLKALDMALSAYIEANGKANPPPFIVDPRPNNTNGAYVQPVIDGRSPTAAVNSVGFFMLQCRSVPAADAALKQLDSRIVREYSPDAPGSTGWAEQPALPTAFDAWDQPIRYVHPYFKGLVPNPPLSSGFITLRTAQPAANELLLPAGPTKIVGINQVRRDNSSNFPDSDGGLNPGTRPYFYSAGPDKNPATVEDNVYLTVPRIQKP